MAKLGGSRENKKERRSWMKGKQLTINVPKLKHGSFCMMATNLNLRFLVILIFKRIIKDKKYETVFKYTVRVVEVTALINHVFSKRSK